MVAFGIREIVPEFSRLAGSVNDRMLRMTGRRHEAWTVLSRHQVFAGGPVESVAVEHVRLPDGTELSDYYQIQLADFVLVYATTDAGKALVLRQYKHGPKRTCMTFPAGSLMHDESPLAAARRELLEETGYASERWVSYGAYVTNANQHCNTAHLFRADGCRKVSEPTAPDVEGPELLEMSEEELLAQGMLEDIGLASHAALLAIATHPRLRTGVSV
jgi:ADP-ribose pyrophosphatase